MPQVPAYAHLSSSNEINYLCNINDDTNFNCKFVRDKKIIVLRNCDTKGNLIDLKTPAKYLECKPWVLLSVRDKDIYIGYDAEYIRNMFCFCLQANVFLGHFSPYIKYP